VGAPARRIYGIETEYGITCASTTGGAPPLDADRAARLLFEPVIARSRTSNAFTRGGARLYLDVGSHPEYATAECDRLTDLLAQDRAGEITMADLAARANADLAARGVPGRIHLLKNNTDSAGAGFGCHENYLVRRRADFWNDARTLVPHLVTRQILVGAGHVLPGADGAPARYVFSQRADQMEDAVSSATTRSRPLINTRDEPHADATRYRRMHVIVGDSNIAQGSTLLKVAAMDLLLDYLEKGGSLADLRLARPMSEIRRVCHDLSGRTPLELADGRTITPIDLQTEHLARVRAHAADLDLSESHRRALDLWERGLDAVARGRPQDVAADLDALMGTDDFRALFADTGNTQFALVAADVRHVLTHRILHATCYLARIQHPSEALLRLTHTSRAELDRYPLPRLMTLLIVPTLWAKKVKEEEEG